MSKISRLLPLGMGLSLAMSKINDSRRFRPFFAIVLSLLNSGMDFVPLDSRVAAILKRLYLQYRRCLAVRY